MFFAKHFTLTKMECKLIKLYVSKKARAIKNYSYFLKIEVRHNLEKETFLKINEMLDTQAVTDGIVMIRFCENLIDLTEFELSFESSPEGSTETDKKLKSFRRLPNAASSYILFMIKIDSISCPINTTAQSAIRSAIKQNMSLSKIWHITILYVKLFDLLI